MAVLSELLERPTPLVMGILNVTPDSFSDGGLHVSVDQALSRALEMAAQGAHIIDIGGESTRPGAVGVSVSEELDRVIPVIEKINNHSVIPISVDTSSPEVMREAASLRVDMINDVRALSSDGSMELVAENNLHVCLMHMQGEPDTMQVNPQYNDVVDDINLFFEKAVQRCCRAGISPGRMILDPGFGFGKTHQQNLALVNRLAEFNIHGLPLMVGLSRKSTLSRIADDVIAGSVAGNIMALLAGAKILRVHDVKQTLSALRVVTAIVRSGEKDEN
ncbi:MAG TPA: dihydropteroate synthase [Gammaproteobacteria bacterium]|nr:dihydropteroate synthase [Gammaproteobacteria bacterium]HIK68795.1 dihydropteroate synthase [Pseudomonadales bacterium]